MFAHLPEELVDVQVEENKDLNFPGTDRHQNKEEQGRPSKGRLSSCKCFSA